MKRRHKNSKAAWATLAKRCAVATGFISILAASGRGILEAQNVGWPAYGGADCDHYSRLTEINRANVKGLRRVWTFDTGEKGDIQANPIIIGRTLYTYTPH